MFSMDKQASLITDPHGWRMNFTLIVQQSNDNYWSRATTGKNEDFVFFLFFFYLLNIFSPLVHSSQTETLQFCWNQIILSIESHSCPKEFLVNDPLLLFPSPLWLSVPSMPLLVTIGIFLFQWHKLLIPVCRGLLCVLSRKLLSHYTSYDRDLHSLLLQLIFRSQCENMHQSQEPKDIFILLHGFTM